MRVLVIGSGGREHALAWRLARSSSVTEMKVWPGNGGTQAAGWSLAGDEATSGDAAAVALALKPDLVVVGPEQPLAEGLADTLRTEGIAVFGPGSAGARLESSKVFAKEFMNRHGIPTASSITVATESELTAALDKMGSAVVLKADGLAAGKGVLLPGSREEAMAAGSEMLSGASFGDAGRRLLIEERLEGWELSMLAIVDGESYTLLPPSQDHKRALEGDRGLNTGGMGAFSPLPWLKTGEYEALAELAISRAIAGFHAEGIDYRGVLYAGLMMTDSGPMVLEYNCRFGDPETQALLPLVDGDFAALLLGAAEGGMDSGRISLHDGAAMVVVLASAGYPGSYEKGHPISGLDDDAVGEAIVFHAGTSLSEGSCLTAGGRVLGIAARAADLPEAARLCYDRIDRLDFAGMTYRRDIGWRVLGIKEVEA